MPTNPRSGPVPVLVAAGLFLFAWSAPSVAQTPSHAGKFQVYEGTKTCLRCHRSQALDVHSSAHYQWSGDPRDIVGNDGRPAGKLGGINDFCIYPDINWLSRLTNAGGQQVDGGCARCHAGLGLKPGPLGGDDTQLENIDCLVCHSEPYRRKVEAVGGVYKLVPDEAAMGMTATRAAQDVRRRPTSAACLRCHARSGGGNNFKRGDLEDAHAAPPRSLDVHMASRASGGAGLACVDCHRTVSHRMAGRGSDIRERDSLSPLTCTKCHPARPHGDGKLDRHTARVNCNVCHVPTFARGAATDMHRDYAAAPEVVPETGLYEPHNERRTFVVPQYRFWNGKSTFYAFGAAAAPGPNGRVSMSAPAGAVTDAGAKINPFKLHVAEQPIDPVTRRLLPLKIGIFFSKGDLRTAVEEGVKGVGWSYNGYEFASTERYLGIFHQVAPEEQALGCSSCHGGTRMDFAALGYTPKSTYGNGKPLCAGCHSDKTNYWKGSERFMKIHEKHVTDKKIDCSACHGFRKAA